MTDRELLARLRAGDAQAFDEVFRRWYPPIVRSVERMLHDRALAEDVAQEAMLELWRRRASLTETGPFQAYLWQTARSRALNYIRHEAVTRRAEPRLSAEDESRGAGADEGAEETEIERALRAAVGDLPPRCREVFELSRGRGLTYAEIASTLGISVKGVEAQMGRALKSLRRRLAPWLPEGDQL